MLEPENAAQNAEYIGYSTPNEKQKALLPKRHFVGRNNSIHLMINDLPS